MNIRTDRNTVIQNPETKPFLADSFYLESEQKLPLVIFIHGYKGYKNWGAWDLMAKQIAKAGFYFVKFNFSHDGTTLQDPAEFADLTAFGENNYSLEMLDLKSVIRHYGEMPETDENNIMLIGHSRGGGIAVIETAENPAVKSLITLASVDSLDRFPKGKAFENWKREGVYYTLNGRTHQQMPHFFQFYQDFDENRARFDIRNAMQKIKARTLIIHGKADESVNIFAAENLKSWNPDAELFLIGNATHTFGAREPWESSEMPADLAIAVTKMTAFLKDS